MKNEEKIKKAEEEKLLENVSEPYKTSKRMVVTNGLSTTHIPEGTIFRRINFSDDSKSDKSKKPR